MVEKIIGSLAGRAKQMRGMYQAFFNGLHEERRAELHQKETYASKINNHIEGAYMTTMTRQDLLTVTELAKNKIIERLVTKYDVQTACDNARDKILGSIQAMQLENQALMRRIALMSCCKPATWLSSAAIFLHDWSFWAFAWRMLQSFLEDSQLSAQSSDFSSPLPVK